MRLAETIRTAQKSGRSAMIAYLPVGYPSLAGSLEAMAAVAEAGAHIIEVGIPYSDPLMDGPLIQAAVNTALLGGTRTHDAFTATKAVRAAGATPVVMSYWNLIDRMGVATFAKNLAAADGAGIITPDLNIDEAGPWLTASNEYHLDRVFLVAPSSTDDRLARTAQASSGFIYAASTMGVTGTRTTLGDEAEKLVTRTRAHTDLPICVGLGVSTPEQANQVAQFADGVIVGSALINALNTGGIDALHRLSVELVEGAA